MPDEPSQKQISKRYSGHADYPQRGHYFRRFRAWVFLATVAASVAGVLAFGRWGKQTMFSPGPISQNHAQFAADCRVCHSEVDDLPAQLKKAASTSRALSHMDAACLKCHPTTSLHLPQAASIRNRSGAHDITLVHASNCASCHREHNGHERMALPQIQSCTSCHGDLDHLNRARELVKGEVAAGTVASTEVQVRNPGDGVKRFITTGPAPAALKPFSKYEDGHPPFAYEGKRDPADLKFNHERHLRPSDLNLKLKGHALGCADCHQPGADGAFMQPIKYEAHCQACHSLQLMPDLPDLNIPHGDPEKVRYFLANPKILFETAVRAEGVSDPDLLKQRVEKETRDFLNNRFSENLNTTLQRVFIDGDPRFNQPLRMNEDRNKFLTACAKCHTVHPAGPDRAPKVEIPVMAERWIQKGPFTHLPHRHMDCVHCHAAVSTSRETSNILLPPQSLCAECHRAPGHRPLPQSELPELVQEQMSKGGIKWECISCHQFHAPPNAQSHIQSLIAPPKEQKE